MDDNAREVASYIFSNIILPSVASGGIVYFVLKKIIENKFNTSIEEYKNTLRKQLEDHRLTTNILFNKISKLHEKEFDILPTAWQKLQVAISAVSSFISPLQQYPDLDNMSDEKLNEFFKKTDLEDSDIKIIKNSNRKTHEYINVIFWYNLNKAKYQYNDFHNYFLLNKIFLSQEIKMEFEKIDSICRSALIERELVGDDWQKSKDKSLFEFDKKADEIRDKIEMLVEGRLNKT